jgi:hypothetical protein
MADSTASTFRFQMVGTRAAVVEGPVAEAIEQQIQAIENALASVPDFAFDLSKTLVESVCKTVLADIGQPAEPLGHQLTPACPSPSAQQYRTGCRCRWCKPRKFHRTRTPEVLARSSICPYFMPQELLRRWPLQWEDNTPISSWTGISDAHSNRYIMSKFNLDTPCMAID